MQTAAAVLAVGVRLDLIGLGPLFSFPLVLCGALSLLLPALTELRGFGALTLQPPLASSPPADDDDPDEGHEAGKLPSR